MRKLLLLAALLCALPAHAQVAQTGAGKATPGGVAFTPSSISGLVAWYKADNDGTNVFTDTACTTAATNSQTVGCWKDKSGNGNDCKQATAGQRPTYLTAGLNSKPTVSFTAASNTGCITASGVAMGTANTASGFFVGFMTGSTSAFGNSFSYCGPTSTACNLSGDFLPGFRNNGANSIEGEKGTVVGAAAAISLSTEFQFGSIADGANIISYLNNSAGSSTAVTDASISAGCIVIGSGNVNACTYNPGSFVQWDGVQSEIVLYNTAINSTDRGNLATYFTGRW